MSGTSPPEWDFLSHYGSVVAQYHGNGELTFDDESTLPCEFHVGQLASADVILLYNIPADHVDRALAAWRLVDQTNSGVSGFHGTTDDGTHLTSRREAWPHAYLPGPWSHDLGTWDTLKLAQVDVKTQLDDRTHSIRYGLTNLLLHGTEKRTPASAGSAMRFLPLSLRLAGREVHAEVVPVPDYYQRKRRLEILRNPEVTCEITVGCDEIDELSAEQLVDDLCYLLSVARGTKVQWIYCDRCDSEGQLVSRRHYSRVTKRYSFLDTIDPASSVGEDTKAFLESTFPLYGSLRDRYRLNRGPIDMMLEGKMDGDFLETRATKLAVSLEMLNSLITSADCSGNSRSILSEAQFSDVKARMTSLLDEIIGDQASRDQMIHKLNELNRKSFSSMLKSMFRQIGLNVTPQDLTLFIQSRNSLVHRGRFHCQLANEQHAEKCKPFGSAAAEYFFLINFVDRLFLRLLGYGGPYQNWRIPMDPVREDNV